MAKYQQYAEYKDSGVEWSETIPSHWKTASLSKLFMIKAGGDLQPALFSETKTLEHKYPIYTNANDSKAVYGYTSKPNFPSNTITVSGRGEVGFAVYRNYEFDAIIRLLVLIPFIKLDGRFFAYFINDVIDFNVQSSAIGQLSTLQISPYKVIIPPYDEQYLISNYLDFETAQIDTLIEKQQTLIQLLKEKRQAVISHAVTKGLNPDVPMKDSGVEWLGEVPAHWVVSSLKYHVDTVNGFGFSSSDVCEEGVPFIRAGNIKKKSIIPTDLYLPQKIVDKYKRVILFEGDIVISMVGSDPRILESAVGQIGVVPKSMAGSVPNQNIVILREKSDLMLKRFLFYTLCSDSYRNHLNVFSHKLANQSIISSSLIINARFMLPSSNEQYKIVEFLDKQLMIFDDLIEKAELAINLMQERRTALISAAVTGKIDVRGWVAPE